MKSFLFLSNSNTLSSRFELILTPQKYYTSRLIFLTNKQYIDYIEILINCSSGLFIGDLLKKHLCLVLTIVCCISTAIGAQLKFNLGPIPYTFQNFGFILAGLLLPLEWAFMSQVLYLILIVIGLPVASGFRGGPYVLVGYTAGYLWMFPIAALLMSILTKLYMGISRKSLDNINLKDYSALLLLSLVAVMPVYIVGFLVFYIYALMPEFRGLYEWSKLVVNKFLGMSINNPFIICFIASTLIFIPQDLLMDHTIAIATAKALYSILKARGLV